MVQLIRDDSKCRSMDNQNDWSDESLISKQNSKGNDASRSRATSTTGLDETDDEAQNFKVYIKMQIVQSTAKQSLSSPSSSSSGVGATSTYTSKSSEFVRQNSTATTGTNSFIQNPSVTDIDSNKFFVYGMFFLSPASTAGEMVNMTLIRVRVRPI